MYTYKELKPKVFTEAGSVMFTQIRDRVQGLIQKAGAVSMSRATHGSTGDSWLMLACVDRLVELAELREVGANDQQRWQDRVFVPGSAWPDVASR